MEQRLFYKVSNDPDDAPLRDYLLHGYENRSDFYDAIRRLVRRWHDRVGERVGERHGFLRLRFHDTPGGRPDEAWIPVYLLKQAEAPVFKVDERSDLEKEIDQAFGFD